MSLLTVLRPARENDAKFIYNSHRHAVQFTCIRSYNEEVLKAWEALLSPDIYFEAMHDKTKALWVVEYKGSIQGFFQLDYTEAQLDALYVHPFSHNQGLGTALLQRAEELAAKAGLSFLKLYASMNSVGFYHLFGYQSLGSAVLPLNESVRIKCELMRKHL